MASPLSRPTASPRLSSVKLPRRPLRFPATGCRPTTLRSPASRILLRFLRFLPATTPRRLSQTPLSLRRLFRRAVSSSMQWSPDHSPSSPIFGPHRPTARRTPARHSPVNSFAVEPLPCRRWSRLRHRSRRRLHRHRRHPLRSVITSPLSFLFSRFEAPNPLLPTSPSLKPVARYPRRRRPLKSAASRRFCRRGSESRRRLQLGVCRKWGDSFSPLPDPYDLCLKWEDTLVSARLEIFRPWVSKFLSNGQPYLSSLYSSRSVC